MIVLDENIAENQRQLLRGWGIRARQIRQDIAVQGVQDEEIVPILHRLRGVTFFSRDDGVYLGRLCHAQYCLMYLDVGKREAASFIRRFLRHPMFDTGAKRMGTVVRVGHVGMAVRRRRSAVPEIIPW